MKHHSSNYYLSRKSKLLKSFDKTVHFARDMFVSRYGEALAARLYKEAREEFEILLPQLPYLDHVFLRRFLIISAQELAVYKVMKRQGKPAGEVWELCQDVPRLRAK